MDWRVCGDKSDVTVDLKALHEKFWRIEAVVDVDIL